MKPPITDTRDVLEIQRDNERAIATRDNRVTHITQTCLPVSNECASDALRADESTPKLVPAPSDIELDPTVAHYSQPESVWDRVHECRTVLYSYKHKHEFPITVRSFEKFVSLLSGFVVLQCSRDGSVSGFMLEKRTPFDKVWEEVKNILDIKTFVEGAWTRAVLFNLVKEPTRVEKYLSDKELRTELAKLASDTSDTPIGSNLAVQQKQCLDRQQTKIRNFGFKPLGLEPVSTTGVNALTEAEAQACKEELFKKFPQIADYCDKVQNYDLGTPRRLTDQAALNECKQAHRGPGTELCLAQTKRSDTTVWTCSLSKTHGGGTEHIQISHDPTKPETVEHRWPLTSASEARTLRQEAKPSHFLIPDRVVTAPPDDRVAAPPELKLDEPSDVKLPSSVWKNALRCQAAIRSWDYQHTCYINLQTNDIVFAVTSHARLTDSSFITPNGLHVHRTDLSLICADGLGITGWYRTSSEWVLRKHVQDLDVFHLEALSAWNTTTVAHKTCVGCGSPAILKGVVPRCSECERKAAK